MSRETRDRPAGDFNPQDLLKSADFFKWEGEDVSDDLASLERQIMDHLAGDTGLFEASIPQTLLAEVGAEIFDTLLSDYLKWYKCSVIAVRMPTGPDRLAFAGYVKIEKPLHLGLGIAYELENADAVDPGPGAGVPGAGVPKLILIPDSVRIVVDASLSVRAAVAAMRVEGSIHHMLADPAGIIRRTLECRLRTAYDCRQPLGDIGLAIEDGLVHVAIHSAVRV